MSASPESEAKPTLPADPVAEEDGQPEQDAKAATPIAGDDDNDKNEGAELKAQVDGADDEDDEELAKPVAAADDDNDDEEDANDDGSDDESILSEVDEAQFEDFDPENVDVEDRPQLAIDEENLKLVGRHKRKRTEEGGDGERSSRRKKEGRREKKTRRMKELEEGGEDDEGEGKSRRREKKKRDATPDEELLDPETRMSFFPSNIDGI